MSWIEATAVREGEGRETKLPTFRNHLLCDESGEFPAVLNKWEIAVLNAETGREGFNFWYRNPDRPTQDSLGIRYKDGDESKIVRPDFLFFAQTPKGSLVVDIVDPHGIHLSDALAKLQGLATYAGTHAKDFRRIESVAEVGGTMRVLNLTDPSVREAVASAASAHSLFEGALAKNY